jgi:regulator of replication initiation timing
MIGGKNMEDLQAQVNRLSDNLATANENITTLLNYQFQLRENYQALLKENTNLVFENEELKQENQRLLDAFNKISSTIVATVQNNKE